MGILQTIFELITSGFSFFAGTICMGIITGIYSYITDKKEENEENNE